MIDNDEASASPADVLCTACGLCCTGRLFIWVKLKSVELAAARELGLNVLGDEPEHRGFGLPCPLWAGKCQIHASPNYPHACRTYKCKLLKNVVDEGASLSGALTVVQQSMELIGEVDALLPTSSNINFRERLVAHMEYLKDSAARENSGLEFQLKAGQLLTFFEKHFGVNDLLDDPQEGAEF